MTRDTLLATLVWALLAVVVVLLTPVLFRP